MKVRAEAKSNPNMTVSEVADRFGVSSNVLRFWEQQGLLHPGRTAGNQRRYTERDLLTIAFIMQGKELGFHLNTISEMLTATADVRWQRSSHQVAALDAEIARLSRARAVIAAGMECPHEDFLDCPWFRQHLAERAGLPPAS